MKRQATRWVWTAGLLAAACFAAGCIGANCVEDGDCGDGLYCDNSVCLEKKAACDSPALACSGPSDCASNRCEDGCCLVACASRLDCADDEECRAGVCRQPTVTDGCKENRDCGGATPLCQVSTGACVGCLTTADCGTSGVRVCGAGNQCVVAAGRCETAATCLPGESCVNTYCKDAPCTKDEECRTGLICAGGVCQAPYGCGSDAECSGDTPRCRSNDRACVECLDKSDCGENELCDPAGTCKQVVCTDDAECEGSAPACERSTGRCVPCIDDDHCGYGARCQNKTCKSHAIIGASCTTLGDCGGGAGVLCVEGFCRARCPAYEHPGRCPFGNACTPVGWDGAVPEAVCLPSAGAREGERCSEAVSCDRSLECVPETATEGRCRRWCDPSDMLGCGAEDVCRKVVTLDRNGVPKTYGLCYPPSLSYLDPCQTSADCDDGLVCGAGPVRSVPTAVTNVCQRPKGTKEGLALCDDRRLPAQDVAECDTGLCVHAPWAGTPGNSAYNGQCQQACFSDAECPEAVASQDGRTTPTACAMVPFEWRNASGETVHKPVPSCVPLCEKLSDCRMPLAEQCVVVPNRAASRWIQRCAPRVGSKIGGASCAAGEECRSGVCLATPRGSICMGFCDPRSESNDCGLDGYCPEEGVVLDRAVLKSIYGESTCGGAHDVCAEPLPICWVRP